MFNIFDNKKVVKNSVGESFLDFTKRSIKWSGNKILIDTTELVTDEFEMRPDLISQYSYGSTNKSDLYLKYNGISNPFSIQSGDIIIIPNEEAMLKEFYKEDIQTFATPSFKRKSVKNLSKEKFNKESGTSWQDKNTPNIAKDNNGNFLPPNIEIKEGKITFGGNIGKSKTECCDVPLSKSEFLNKIIKNRIKNGS